MNNLRRRSDPDHSGSSLVPTAIPLATGSDWVPPHKPRWSTQLAKPIAYGLVVVALGVAGVLAVGSPTILIKRAPASPAPVMDPPVMEAETPESVTPAPPPMVVLEQDTIVWRPPLRLDEP